MDMPTIGINNYYHKHNTKKSGNSYTEMKSELLIEAVKWHWPNRIPGAGERDLSRKVLVNLFPNQVENLFHCGGRARLIEGLPVQTRIEARCAGERPSLVHFVWYSDAVAFGAYYEPKTSEAEVVVYSKAALSENGDKPDTDCDWEIITLLCSSSAETEPMPPLTMARNQLQEKGGTYGEYSGLEYAKAIWFHSMKDLKVRYDS